MFMWFPEMGGSQGVWGWGGVESDMWIAWKFTSQLETDLLRFYEKLKKKKVTYSVS